MPDDGFNVEVFNMLRDAGEVHTRGEGKEGDERGNGIVVDDRTSNGSSDPIGR